MNRLRGDVDRVQAARQSLSVEAGASNNSTLWTGSQIQNRLSELFPFPLSLCENMELVPPSMEFQSDFMLSSFLPLGEDFPEWILNCTEQVDILTKSPCFT